MPSQTIHIPTETYGDALDAKDDDQSTSARFAELIKKGLEFEQKVQQ